MTSGEQLKAKLKHTWPVFLAHHGRFTPVQQAAIPPILQGQDVLVMAATASGKTEAVITPLIERYRPPPHELQILYICPTRALVRDLYERLTSPLSALNVTLAMKTGDTGPVSPTAPPAVLITTPESTDSLLTRAARLFTTLKAVVLDEIHLFDNTPRGDHLRCLLPRIERIRQYAQPECRPTQRIALSATVSDPAGVAHRYLTDPVIIQVEGQRHLKADITPMYGLADLVGALAQRPLPKTLIFCNTRNEVEQTAAYLRHHLPYETAVFVHYSNLDQTMRQEIETRFAQAAVAICVASSTLELGIDIGSIDQVALIGPPPTFMSFWQRIGRGGRRTDTMPVLCLPRSALELLRFETFINDAHLPPQPYAFRPAILIQQIFSLLKQSPTGGLRLADVRRIAPATVSDETLNQILAHLTKQHYLRHGRLGEWRADTRLDDLIDVHDIYTNIGGERLAATIIDAYTGRPIAQTKQPRRKGDTLLMGGKPMQVAWQDRYKLGIERGQRASVDERLHFDTAPFAVPFELAQAMAHYLGLTTGQMPIILADDGMWLFHFLGDIYGKLLTAILQIHFPIEEWETPFRAWNEVCLFVPLSLLRLPQWDAAITNQALQALWPHLIPSLELGRFYELLPPPLAQESALAQCHLSRFEAAYHAAILCPSAALHDQLLALL